MTLPAQIDAAFLAKIEQWRESLACHLARRNPALTDGQFNYAVQITIDRLIFLRICEDRGLERHGQLMALSSGANIYRPLMALFRKADRRYRSRLFYFKHAEGRSGAPDELTPELIIEDEPLKEILRSLYCPQDLSKLSVLPAEILGQAYEQSLGKVIIRTDDPAVRVVDKPEVKRSGGVFYTPAEIVDYLVKQTVGKLLEGCTVLPDQTRPARLHRPLRVLDPACGAGSLLLGAYQQLLDWYRIYYEQHDPEIWTAARVPPIYRAGPRGWRLTLAERQRILLDHIYGVDIDPQAVEIAKLSLLLKVFDAEANARAQALPDLAGNIKCGNSLIGPDFFADRPPAASDEQRRLRINAFDWPAEFPEAVRNGGFDTVIGNPPWGQKEMGLGEEVRKYLRSKYVSLAGIMDIFRPFVEKSIHLLAPGGRYGMVLPDVVLLKDYPQTRLFMLQNLCLSDICWWGMAFGNAVIDATTIVARKGSVPDGHSVQVRIQDNGRRLEHEIPQTDFLANPRYTFNLYLTREKRAILRALDTLPKLGDFFEIHEGIHSGNMRAELFVDWAADGTCKPLYFGRDEIAPYQLRWKGRHVRLGAVPDQRNPRKYANLGRRQWHEHPKVLVRRTGDHVLAAVDDEGLYASNNFFLLFPHRDNGLDLHGLCALLNSRFTTWYFRCIEPRQGRVFAELKIKHLRVFPIPKAIHRPSACRRLNALGYERAIAARHPTDGLSPCHFEAHSRNILRIDECVDECVLSMLGLGADLQHQII